jgi:hypothetical protein
VERQTTNGPQTIATRSLSANFGRRYALTFEWSPCGDLGSEPDRGTASYDGTWLSSSHTLHAESVGPYESSGELYLADNSVKAGQYFEFLTDE